jgi:hypothetical protein
VSGTATCPCKRGVARGSRRSPDSVLLHFGDRPRQSAWTLRLPAAEADRARMIRPPGSSPPSFQRARTGADGYSGFQAFAVGSHFVGALDFPASPCGENSSCRARRGRHIIRPAPRSEGVRPVRSSMELLAVHEKGQEAVGGSYQSPGVNFARR